MQGQLIFLLDGDGEKGLRKRFYLCFDHPVICKWQEQEAPAAPQGRLGRNPRRRRPAFPPPSLHLAVAGTPRRKPMRVPGRRRGFRSPPRSLPLSLAEHSPVAAAVHGAPAPRYVLSDRSRSPRRCCTQRLGGACISILGATGGAATTQAPPRRPCAAALPFVRISMVGSNLRGS
jgi:hypothetical protein